MHDDWLFEGGTVLACDAEGRTADWLWVQGGRVRALGSGPAPASLSGSRYELKGRCLVPAFCDAHVHLTWLATSLLGPDLSTCDGVPSVLERLRAWRGPGRGPEGGWVVGHGFDESTWRQKRLPTREELDGVEPRRPVLLQRACGHVGILNSAALANVVPGPHTDLAAGRLAEDDLYAVNDRLRPSVESLQEVWPDVARMLHTHGITSVHDVLPPELWQALGRVRAERGLGVRVSGSVPARHLDLPANPPGAHQAHRLEDLLDHTSDPELRVLGVKVFVDGSLGAHTAYLRQPYADAAETRGVPLYAPEDLAALVRRVDGAGLQLMVHAIGDAALDRALDALEPVVSGGNPLRHRLEHVEVTPPDLVERLVRSHLWVCAQPNFAARWSGPGGMNEQRLGSRLHLCNAYRSLVSAGVPVAFGSDTMPLGPLFGLQGAIEHPLESERLDAATALRAYTAASAALVFSEARHGRIGPGLEADLVVLNQIPRPGIEWRNLRIEATFHAGRPVFEASGRG